jgi:hypothetical protein
MYRKILSLTAMSVFSIQFQTLVSAQSCASSKNQESSCQKTSCQNTLPAISKGKKSLLQRDTDEASSATASDSKTTKAIPIGTGANVIAETTSTNEPMRKVDRKVLTATPAPNGGETIQLKYQFVPGLVISSEVTHLAKTDAKVDSSDQNSDSRTVSHKTWEVTRVDNGEMTFEYRIIDIDMSQRIGVASELRYNSKSNEQPPKQFQSAAESIGKLISTVTIDEQGMIIARSDDTNPPNLGMGDITLPVPPSPIAVGASWEIPRELRIRRDDGSLKTVRFRELFRLERVSAGVASISVRSEMLTAVTEPKEEAQVLQQLSNGTIKFDIDAGRMISKELSWDKTVVGFSGGSSMMDYSARLEEQVVKAEPSASTKRSASKSNETKK